MVDAGGQGADVVGVDGREHADPQLVAAELAVGLDVDDAVARAAPWRSPRRRPSRRSRSVPTTSDRWPGRSRTGSRTRTSPPSRRAGPTTRGCASTAPDRPPSECSQPDLVGQQEQRGDGRGVVGLVLRRVVDGDREVEEAGDPAARRLDLGDPGERRGGTSARATGRRRRRRTSAARSSRRRSAPTSTGSPPAPLVASMSTSASSSAPAGPHDRRHHAGRGLVVRPARRRRRPPRPSGSASEPGSALAITGVVEERRLGDAGGELRGELPVGAVRAALAG